MTQPQDGATFPAAEGLTQEVAEFVVNTRVEDLPAEVVEHGKKSILDGLGLALAGSVAESGELVRSYLRLARRSAAARRRSSAANLQGRRRASRPSPTASPSTPTTMTTRSSRSAKDRVYGLLTHPTAPCPSAGPGARPRRDGRSGRDLMLAYHLGVEVECKIAEAIAPRHYQHGFHATGTCGTFAAAAAAARLRGLDVEQTARALSIAASQSAGLRENFGTMTKPFHAGRSAESGVVAAEFAALGWTAAPTHPGSAARLLPRRRRRLRPRGYPGQARQALDLRLPGRVDQAASVRLAHPPGHDRHAAPDQGARHPRRAGRACRRGHQPEHAQRPDPSPPEERAAGQVQHGVLHGHPAHRAARRASTSSPTRWSCAPTSRR